MQVFHRLVGVGTVLRSATLALMLAAGSCCGAGAQEIQVEDAAKAGRRLAQQLSLPTSRAGLVPIEGGTAVDPALAFVTVNVRSTRIVGNTALGEDDLADVLTSLNGRRVTLAEVYAAADAITRLYRDRGYVLSRAYLPPQEIDPKGATIQIAVLEGFIDDVVWPEEVASYRNMFAYYEQAITSERPVRVGTIERYLLLANKLPGLSFTTTLAPSDTTPGAATMFVAMEAKPVSASLGIDNKGTDARGPVQVRGRASLDNILRLHERVEVTAALTTETKEMQFLKVALSALLHPEGLEGFANASISHGEPGTEALRLLMFTSRSIAFEAGLSLPVLLTREKSLTLSALMFTTDSEADALGVAFTRDRLRGVRLKADGQWLDPWGGATAGQVTLSAGFDVLGATRAGDPNASRAAASGSFAKIEATVSHVHPLAPSWSILTQVHGQYAFTPLLASEECGFGGEPFGRALDSSSLAGDSCVLASGEVRYDLDVASVAPNWTALDAAQLYGFADIAAIYRIAPAAGGLPGSMGPPQASAPVRFGRLMWPQTSKSARSSLDLSLARGRPRSP